MIMMKACRAYKRVNEREICFHDYSNERFDEASFLSFFFSFLYSQPRSNIFLYEKKKSVLYIVENLKDGVSIFAQCYPIILCNMLYRREKY
jgi:hypothetical protein